MTQSLARSFAIGETAEMLGVKKCRGEMMCAVMIVEGHDRTTHRQQRTQSTTETLEPGENWSQRDNEVD